MEVVNESSASLKGKFFSCVEASISLSPCATSLKALSSLCLIGKVIAPMFVDDTTISELVTKVWKKNVSIFSLSDTSSKSNCFRFGFTSVEDREWVLVNGPWTVKGYSLALKAWIPTVQGPTMVDCMRVWVQVHNLSHEYFSVENGTFLGGLIRNVVNIKLVEDNPMSWKLFFKILVDINIDKPLMSGCYFDLASGVKRWIQFKPLVAITSGPPRGFSGRFVSVAGNKVGGTVRRQPSTTSRGSRRFKKVTSRGLLGQGQEKLHVWKPKIVPESCGERITGNGKQMGGGPLTGAPHTNSLRACESFGPLGPTSLEVNEPKDFSTCG
ncbi:hypothetical protein F8388_001217 [Cannabis sativa]|uniref:DUF4283 domain-containing protein n=1 Tax=Cannabis sativa TaxID=3483 RepID=A0A7J6GGU5_CANSA|nr:hypothetical protein F8388_001217 [Cannabis sativa]